MSAEPPHAESTRIGTASADGRSMWSKVHGAPSGGLRGHLVAVALVSLALLVRWILNSQGWTEAPYMPVLVAVLGAAWYGGLWPGIVATASGGIVTAAVFFEPASDLPLLSVRKLAWFGGFLGMGLLISWMNHSLHLALRQVKDVLEKGRQAEEMLRGSETRFRRAIDEAPLPAVLHAEDGTILMCNRAWTEQSGYTLKQLPRMSDWIERSCQTKEKAQVEAQRIFTEGHSRIEHGEIVAITAQGRTLTWDFSSAVLGKLPDGRLLAISMAKDVTQRKQVEQELIRLNTAVESAANGIVIVDRAGLIVWVNPAFSRMTGYTREEAVGQHTRLLKSGEHEKKFYQDLWATVVAGRVWRGVICNRRKDGVHYHEEMTITPIADERGRILHFVAIKEDITDKQHLQSQLQQSQKLEAIGQLAGGVAHDFNNLLTIISGYSELLLAMLSPTDPTRESVKAIYDAGARAASLTRQLLAFSRKTVLEPKVLDLNDVVKETEKMLRRLIGEDVLLSFVPDPRLQPVRVDPGLIGQVLMNLAVNARDAMPQGGKLSIETRNWILDQAYCDVHPGARSGRYVQLTVTDTGCGMTHEIRAHVFEPFFTTKGAGKGTGLGLAVVYGIVKQNNGYIEVYSEPDIGTSFKIYFPAVEDETTMRSAEPFASAVPHGSETVLLVEDEEGVRGIALMALQTHGYQVLAARDGKEALRIVEKHQGTIDLLVTDVVMPQMSGRELAENLITRAPHMKALFMSGYTDDAVIRHGLVDEKIAFLQKPFSPLALARKVRAVLDEKA